MALEFLASVRQMWSSKHPLLPIQPFVCDTNWTALSAKYVSNPVSLATFERDIYSQFKVKRDVVCRACQGAVVPLRWRGEFPVSGQAIQLEYVLWCLQDFQYHFELALTLQAQTGGFIGALAHYQSAYRSLDKNIQLVWPLRKDHLDNLYKNLFIKDWDKLPKTTPFKLHWLMLPASCKVAQLVVEAGMVRMYGLVSLKAEADAALARAEKGEPPKSSAEAPKAARLAAMVCHVRQLYVEALQINMEIGAYRPLTKTWTGLPDRGTGRGLLELKALEGAVKHLTEEAYYRLSLAHPALLTMAGTAMTWADILQLSECLHLATAAKESAQKAPVHIFEEKIEENFKAVSSKWTEVLRCIPPDMMSEALNVIPVEVLLQRNTTRCGARPTTAALLKG